MTESAGRESRGAGREAGGAAGGPDAGDARPARRDAGLVLLFVVGALLINFPLLAIANRPATLGGIPVLYLYLFGVWLAGIAAVFALVGRPRGEEE